MIYGAYSSEEPNDAFIQGEMNCPSIILGFKTHAARMEFAAMIAQMKIQAFMRQSSQQDASAEITSAHQK